MTDFRQLLNALVSADVRFVLIGGAAIIAHGSAYVTQDLDILFLQERRNSMNLAIALAPFKPRLRGAEEAPFILDDRTLMNGQVFTLATSCGDLDLLAEVSGAGRYQDVIQNAVTLDLAGLRIQVLSIPDLIRAKRASGRPKDVAILSELEAMLEIENDEK